MCVRSATWQLLQRNYVAKICFDCVVFLLFFSASSIDSTKTRHRSAALPSDSRHTLLSVNAPTTHTQSHCCSVK